MKTSWPSPAKINLFLYITSQRKDGYHTLQTMFQFLNYGDLIHISLRNDSQIRLLTLLKNVDNKDNLILRAANLLMFKTSCKKGVDIVVDKYIPIGSGLGGGSSNAATTLVALNQLWNCGLSEEELLILGLKLGADVPIFIYGHAAFAEGIGEKFSQVFPPEKWYLIICPKINISTSLILRDPFLSRNKPKRSIETLLKYKFSNDCEVIARKYFREVDFAFSWLLKYAPARLTGTGACIFSEFDTPKDAYQILKQIPKWLYGFVAQGINTSPLKQAVTEYNRFKLLKKI